MFPFNEGWDVFHWTWTVQGIHRNQIFKNGGFQVFQMLLHSWTFILEYADRITALKELKCLGIVQWDVFNVDFYAVLFFDEAKCILDDGKGF